MKVVRRICAVIVGTIFFVAGMLKLMDPVGTGLIVQEYFKFLHLAFLIPISKVTAVALSLFETLLGAAMITGVWPRVTGLLTGIVLIGFTVLTLFLWIFNPPMDCGCFGEALHLNHAQSFWKNIALVVLWGIAYIPLGKAPTARRAKHVSFWITVVSMGVFTFMTLKGIPPIDFTTFKPGVTLMQAQYGAAPDSPLLSISDADGEYCDDLLSTGTVMFFSKYDPEDIPARTLSRIDSFKSKLDSIGVKTVTAVSSVNPGPDEYSADRRTLMTVNRSNGGVTLFSDGLIVAKWPASRLPDVSFVADLASSDATEAMMKENAPRRMRLQGFLLYVFAVLLLL